MQLNTYLMFQGECKAAFELYAQVLDGEIEATRFGMLFDRFGTPWMINRD